MFDADKAIEEIIQEAITDGKAYPDAHVAVSVAMLKYRQRIATELKDMKHAAELAVADYWQQALIEEE
jgi:hypothetical protein